ncbi:hypothetical protein ACJ73_05188 [Blastomyces percursus]|uniref:Ketoreductase (KR) domain-containing protein n=1 Tax=Blastomyces percursus TaxID=1658174 RepID=A0A1J9R4M6_9EURO|nr:hypothetical protein ACJ73_05188 [Blastomyces percursus]
MVSLPEVQSSNCHPRLALLLVAVFVGATGGIGESTLKPFANYAKQPRACFVGRSRDAADRIVAECKALNPEGKYIFVKADISLIHVADGVCEQIKAKENALSMLILSAGVPLRDRSKTAEGIRAVPALIYYSRIHFITKMLPLLQCGASLRRVVTVIGDTQEGPLEPTDFPALRLPLKKLLLSTAIQGPWTLHCSGICTASLENSLHSRFLWCTWRQAHGSRQGKAILPVCRFQTDISLGTTRTIEGGVYSVGSDCEAGSPDVKKLFAELRNKRMIEEVWNHTEVEFKWICGSRVE